MTRYIIFELAKILWDNGYRFNTESVFNVSDEKIHRLGWSTCTISDFNGMYISRPRIYEVIEWLLLRGIYISITPPTDKSEQFNAKVYRMYDKFYHECSNDSYFKIMNESIILATKLL
jgi:hypothetical protein